jgi:hypothetical protein
MALLGPTTAMSGDASLRLPSLSFADGATHDTRLDPGAPAEPSCRALGGAHLDHVGVTESDHEGSQ